MIKGQDGGGDKTSLGRGGEGSFETEARHQIRYSGDLQVIQIFPARWSMMNTRYSNLIPFEARPHSNHILARSHPIPHPPVFRRLAVRFALDTSGQFLRECPTATGETI